MKNDFFDSFCYQFNDFNSNMHYNENTKNSLLSEIQTLKIIPDLSPSFTTSLSRVEQIVKWLYISATNIDFAFKLLILNPINMKWLLINQEPKLKPKSEISEMFKSYQLTIANNYSTQLAEQLKQYTSELEEIILNNHDENYCF